MGRCTSSDAYYSVPFVWIGAKLWLRATATMVQVFRDHELVASHTRCQRPGQWSTVADHLPPEAQAYLRQTPDWCRKEAKKVGPACRAVVDQLFADKILDRLKSVQGLLRLRKGYGDSRLESACRRALAFDHIEYRTIKTILSNGLDQVALQEEAFDRLAEVYTGSRRFNRDIRTLLVH